MTYLSSSKEDGGGAVFITFDMKCFDMKWYMSCSDTVSSNGKGVQ